MKRIVYVAILLLLSCISFNSCNKEEGPNSLKNEIKDAWNDSHGTKITIGGKQITLPPNDEIWMWVTEFLASDIIENEVTIESACERDVLSHKLYNDNGKYVLCIKLEDEIGELESAIYDFEIKFNKDICLHKTEWYWYDNKTKHGIKRIVFPPNVSGITLSQNVLDSDRLDEMLEEVYFSDNVYELSLDLPALKKIYISEYPLEYEGDTPYYKDYNSPKYLGLNNYNSESLEIPEGWCVNITSETLKTLILNSKGALYSGYGNYECAIICPKLEKLVLDDEIRKIYGGINCPSLNNLELPKQLIELEHSIHCNIESLTIPENVNYIWISNLCDYNQDGNGELKEIYFRPTTPPTIMEELGDEFKRYNVTVYVPSESYSEYMKKDFFKNLNTVAYEF